MTLTEESCVPDMIAKAALEAGPITKAGLTLAPLDAGPITSIAVFPGGAKSVAKALKPLGLTFPEPGHWASKAQARIVWTGRDQAFLMGVAAPEIDGAALTDQSDAWAGFTLTGPGAAQALARLVALDLRVASFPPGRAARTGLNHMAMVLLRTGDEAFTLFVFRSMARSAWAELAEVLDRQEARAALKS
ncbi:MAG: sarcosine oxidase subunit gamma [Paracoccaceae bacterium]